MNLGLMLQAVVAGAAAGAVYGLVGLGYGLIYRMSGVLNFAHGDIVTSAIFTFLLVVGGGAAVAVVGLSASDLLRGVVVALVLAGAAAFLVQRAAVAPFLARGSTAGWIAATVAMGFLLRALVGILFQGESYSVPDVLPIGGRGLVDLPGGGVLQVRSLLLLLVAVTAAVGFDRWLSLSRVGRAMRAVSQDAGAARLCGISPERLRGLAWVLAGLMAGVAGLLIAPTRPITLEFGVLLGLKGTAAAVIGRLGSARGTIVAGLAIGIAESLLTTLSIPGPAIGGIHFSRIGPFPALQDVTALLALVVVIVLLPAHAGDAGEEVD